MNYALVMVCAVDQSEVKLAFTDLTLFAGHCMGGAPFTSWLSF